MGTHPHVSADTPTATDRDPVCGMTVRVDSPHRATYGGREYVFCGAGCKRKFEADPESYLRAPAPAAPPSPASKSDQDLYTCPMDPEVRQRGPGACPKCGMALEPVQVSAPADGVVQALKDPVCAMTVTARSPHVLQHEGKPVYFCSAGCKAKFAANPAMYPVAASGSAAPAPGSVPAPAMTEAVAVGAVYTCPMHPEVRQDGPGACPKCGMALEPEMPTLDEGENPELRNFRRRCRHHCC